MMLSKKFLEHQISRFELYIKNLEYFRAPTSHAKTLLEEYKNLLEKTYS